MVGVALIEESVTLPRTVGRHPIDLREEVIEWVRQCLRNGLRIAVLVLIVITSKQS